MNDQTNQSHTVSGLFNDRDSAEKAYQLTKARGYSHDDVNLMMSDDTRNKQFGEGTAHTELSSKALEGAGTGSALGGTIGAIIGGIAAIGTNLVLPGLGLIVWGPVAAALAGAGAGGLTGGLVGALVGSGIPQETAVEYENGIKNGGVYMGVNARNQEDAAYFHDEFSKLGGSHVVGTGAGVVGGAVAGAAIGSAVPVVGTAIGGVVGGIVGGAAGHEIAESTNPEPGDESPDHAVGTSTGAVGGAIAGATVGSVVPVVGTAVGGVVGAVGGAVAGHEAAEKVNPDDKLIDDDKKLL